MISERKPGAYRVQRGCGAPREIAIYEGKFFHFHDQTAMLAKDVHWIDETPVSPHGSAVEEAMRGMADHLLYLVEASRSRLAAS